MNRVYETVNHTTKNIMFVFHFYIFCEDKGNHFFFFLLQIDALSSLSDYLRMLGQGRHRGNSSEDVGSGIPTRVSKPFQHCAGEQRKSVSCFSVQFFQLYSLVPLFQSDILKTTTAKKLPCTKVVPFSCSIVLCRRN